ncbi:aminotransferase class I/II-fold pyridoxal phosphate-dependent enzyme [Candidatus Uhrbacteria bacterium]|nr:aminotransferase class I/II-fold pyridoxal phosphate-dependent enzyme [Candidatus Uhrbacteria bacterium]
MKEHPGVPVFDASQGDGGASLPGLSPQELAEALLRFLPQTHATSYGTPQGDVRVRRAIFQNHYHLSASLGLTLDHIVLTDGGRDGLQKFYQAMGLLSGQRGGTLLCSGAPWISYGPGSYLSGLNLLCAPCSSGDFHITPDGIDEAFGLAHTQGGPAAALVLTSPDNPTGTYYTPDDLLDATVRALSLDVPWVLWDFMYQMVLEQDAEPYSLDCLLSHLEPRERERIVVLDGLTKAVGASNVRSAHLVCGSRALAGAIAAIASHTVLPNALGEACAFELYQSDNPRMHPWVHRVTAPTNQSRAILRAALERERIRFVADQGYYAFIDLSEAAREHDWTSTTLCEYFTAQHGLAMVPGDPFFQPGWVRFSLAQAPADTQGAVGRLLEGLRLLT